MCDVIFSVLENLWKGIHMNSYNLFDFADILRQQQTTSVVAL